MRANQLWPDGNNRIIEVEYELVSGFDDEDDPVYSGGKIVDENELVGLQDLLETAERNDSPVTSVAMGKVILVLEKGDRLEILPVFHPLKDTYEGFFYLDDDQYFMDPGIAELLEKWRRQ